MREQKRRLDGVFEGGGVKGIALVGALEEIEQAGYHFVNVAGTSAGAIVATLVAAGYSAAELKPIILTSPSTSSPTPPGSATSRSLGA